jgi:hypothetical protein
VRRFRRALGSALAALAAAGCAIDFRPAARVLGEDAESERAAAVVERRRTYFDAAQTRLRREWIVLASPDGRAVQHGLDREWFPDGTLASERSFDHGEPSGAWRTWYASGAPRSEATFGTREPAPMRWWHENGRLSTEGLAVGGARTGAWRSWHENGELASRGSYVAGRREGPWEYFAADGALIERGEFRADVRVGTWERGPAAP